MEFETIEVFYWSLVSNQNQNQNIILSIKLIEEKKIVASEKKNIQSNEIVIKVNLI